MSETYSTIEGYKLLIVAIIIQAINDYLANNKKAHVKRPEAVYTISRQELITTLRDFYSDEDRVSTIMKQVDYLYNNGAKWLKGDM